MNIKSCPTYDKNPFEKTGIEDVLVTSGNSIEKLVVDPDTAEHYSLRSLNKKRNKKYDKRSFRKIYTDSIDTIKDFSQPGYKMFFYILKHLEEKKDYIDLNLLTAMGYCNYKNKSSFYEGVEELLKKNCIARCKTKNRYFINSNMFFNGDRTR